jgi:trans-aconitate 2-methyltransferase
MDVQTKNWYNSFASSQIKTSINLRHYKIINYLFNEGLNANSRVLEIGCGIGTLTKLIAKSCPNGNITATDISDDSINYAKKFLSNFKNTDFIVTNMSDFKVDKKFDIIVLADVLEHIPKTFHSKLFSIIFNHMNESSVLIIHIPHFKLIEFLKENNPEMLQIIDQPIYPNELVSSAESNKLFLTNYKAYNLFNKDIDYVFASFRKLEKHTRNELPRLTIIKRKVVLRVLYLFRLYFSRFF